MIDEKKTDEYWEQNKQYSFPYHHIPHIDYWRGHMFPSMDRYLWFGFEYLGYCQHIIRMIMEFKPKSVLDVGCGDGRFLQLLGEEIKRDKKYNIEMLGIDISNEAIVLANALNVDSAIEYKAMEVSEVTTTYDCVTCIETLEHIPDDLISDVVHGIYKCLKPGGIAVICVPTTNRPKEKKHFRHYNMKVMMEELLDSEACFKIKNVQYFWKNHALERYLKATSNRFLYIRFRMLDNWLWKKSFKANEKTGCHMIITLEKNG